PGDAVLHQSRLRQLELRQLARRGAALGADRRLNTLRRAGRGDLVVDPVQLALRRDAGRLDKRGVEAGQVVSVDALAARALHVDRDGNMSGRLRGAVTQHDHDGGAVLVLEDGRGDYVDVSVLLAHDEPSLIRELLRARLLQARALGLRGLAAG